MKLSKQDLSIFFKSIFKKSEPNQKLRDARDMYSEAVDEFEKTNNVWPVLNKDQTQKALNFYKRHIDIILSETAENIGIYPPSYESLDNPLEWSFENWAWFIRATALTE